MRKKLAIITGATSGIGAAYAELLASKNYNLIITGRRAKIINKLAKNLISKYKIEIKVIIIELSNDSELNKFTRYIKKIKNIDILINNAGFGSRKSFFEDSYLNQEKMINVHITATTKIVYAVTPKMIKQNMGIIINVSSIAAFLSGPESTIYCATKAFLNTFSKSIYIALKKYNIKVQALCPGFTRTDFHDKLKIDNKKLKNHSIIRWMTAKKVALLSYKNIKKNKVVYIPGFSNKLLHFLIILIPDYLYFKLAEKYSKKVLQK